MHSNAYTYRFIIILTGIAALLLSLASTSLKARQDFNRALDTKRNVLKAVGEYSQGMKGQDIEKAYKQNITERFVDSSGNISQQETELPLYIYGPGSQPKGFILFVSGKGLWSTVNGFLALQPDCNTVMGITFYEHGETPGLGGEIEKDWFTSQFVGKQIFDKSGKLVSIRIAKGLATRGSLHEVDGISGSTLTGNGLNQFIKQDLEAYSKFLQKQILKLAGKDVADGR